MSKTKSQTDWVLEYLRSGNTITPLEALRMFGIMRLGARIRDLKDLKHNIVTEMEKNEGKRYARYKLIKKTEKDGIT